MLFGRTVASPFSFCAFFNSCEPVDVDFLSRTQRLASLSATATIPRANNPVDPTRGYVATTEVTLASRYIGSSAEQQFTRVLADYAWYRPILRDVVLSWRVRGGMIFSPVHLEGSDVPYVPPEQRFYGGGPSDVRGYQRNQLGPVIYYATRGHVDSTEANGEPLDPDQVRIAATGGNTMAVGNLELRIPSPIFSERLRLAAFVDVGGVWQRGATAVDLRVTPGFGIRVSTPLGPARFDVGGPRWADLPLRGRTAVLAP
jgi:outer membrane protein assembly factor BamA